MCGDFKARTADNTGFIINDEQDVYNCYDDKYVFDLCDKRVSNGNVISNRGRQLLDLSIKCSLRILNGRPFSYLKFTRYVTNIIAEPKYKYRHQEQVTVRNHNRSTALERSV